MEPSLMVVGLNHRSAPIAMRERFWVEEEHRRAALRELSEAEGIEEIIILSTCCRIEFVVWTSDATLAVNSLLHHLTEQHGLKLSEWEHFYRLLDDAALGHIFRVAAGLDSTALGEAAISEQVQSAWQLSRQEGSSANFLDVVFGRALAVAQKVRTEIPLPSSVASIPNAVAALASEIFGSLQGKQIVVIGTTEMSQRCARRLAENDAPSLTIVGHTREEARDLAQKINATAIGFEQRWDHILRADMVVSCSRSPRIVLTRQDAEKIAAERQSAPLVIVDLSVPRSVDPDVHRVEGVLLCDLVSLDRLSRPNDSLPGEGIAAAEKIVSTEVQGFHGRLRAETSVSTMLALRRRLDEICRQEVESFTKEHGPFSREQDQALHAITTKVIQKIASSLARELKGLPKKEEQEQVTAVIEKLFHLKTPATALAGASSKPGAAHSAKASAFNVH